MASGAERAARKRRFAAKVAAGVVPAPRVAWRPRDLPSAVRQELDAHRVDLANQRARVRGARLAQPKRNESAAPSAQTDDRAAALLEHLAEAT